MKRLIKDFHILIASSKPSQRSGLRKTLCDLGAENRFIEVSADFARTVERLKKDPINLLIVDDDIGDEENALELVDLFIQNNPLSRERIFILLSSNATPFLMAEFTLRGGDKIINKPFNNEDIIKSVTSILAEMKNISEEEGLVLDVQDAIRKNDFDLVNKIIASFKNSSCSQAYLSQAMLHEAKQEPSLACDMFLKVLEQNINFRSLVGLVKSGVASKKYNDLLRFVEVWLKSFPVHHGSLPDITRVIIINQKFDLLDNLFQVFIQHKINDNFAHVYLAAGFVLAASYNQEYGEKEKSKNYALKAIEYSSKRFNILTRALTILKKINKNEAESAYLKINIELQSPEYRILDLKLKEIIYPRNIIFSDCQKLLAEKIVDLDLYLIAISCLREIGKDPQDLISLAKRNFPKIDFGNY